ncbi:hypothetical protein ACMYR3_06765 [Ampullimonas aquatilis]|uniref:hypothetical protein n=1 Tax=Ampullimonas aquatilis TaxID=1341549 RepID=UPI003C7719E4
MVLIVLAIILGYSAYLIYRAYQIGIKHQLNLVRDWGGRQLPNPEKYRIVLACVYLVSGSVLIAVTFALIATKTSMKSWSALVFLIGQCYVIAYSFIAWRAKKNAS